MFRRLLACLFVTLSAHAGILISRSDQGLQFTDATSLLFNGKEKVLSLGARPAAASQLSKLPAARLSGAVFKDPDSGVLAQYSAGRIEYLVPQVLAKGSPDDPAAVWKTAKIVFKQSSADKAGTEVPSEAFVAFLPGGLEELVRLCTDSQALALLGGKAKASGTQMEWMSAVVRKYPNGPALAPIEQYLEGAMRTRYVAFENGTGGLDLLQQGLEFAKLSQAVYPNLPNQEKLRTELAERKAWLDRRLAILRALAVASQWDAYIIAARDFDRYRHAFPMPPPSFNRLCRKAGRPTPNSPPCGNKKETTPARIANSVPPQPASPPIPPSTKKPCRPGPSIRAAPPWSSRAAAPHWAPVRAAPWNATSSSPIKIARPRN
jgi:hypothetical protein